MAGQIRKQRNGGSDETSWRGLSGHISRAYLHESPLDAHVSMPDNANLRPDTHLGRSTHIRLSQHRSTVPASFLIGGLKLYLPETT